MPISVRRSDLVDIHSLKVDQILCSNLSPEQAIKIVKDFHVENGLIGVVETDIEFLRFDECYSVSFEGDKSYKGCRLWFVLVNFTHPVTGNFKSYMLVVDDNCGEVVFYTGYGSGLFDEEGNIEPIVVFDKSGNTINRVLYPCYLNKSFYEMCVSK